MSESATQERPLPVVFDPHSVEFFEDPFPTYALACATRPRCTSTKR